MKGGLLLTERGKELLRIAMGRESCRRICSISLDTRSGRIVARDEKGNAIDSRHAVIGWLGVQLLEKQMAQQGWRIEPAKEK